ncbi:hypothetical protein E2C01_090062 [Portunus trituberculatus]|uniref:Uncharacterized protein n=1 Tax=Portunus trituberculatus TaxID=210409 RepID=A0A5B7JKE6_PORTR|nr:hypothetical protein [Portunus trituberculatus]
MYLLAPYCLSYIDCSPVPLMYSSADTISWECSSGAEGKAPLGVPLKAFAIDPLQRWLCIIVGEVTVAKLKTQAVWW